MASPAAIRASDADRERVAELLRRAAGEGRLRTEELEQRLEDAFAARTYGDLDRIVADLPGTRELTRRPSSAALGLPRRLIGLAAVALTLALSVAIVFALTGVLAGWMLWLLVGWWFFGRRRHRAFRARDARATHACGGWQRSRSGFWV